MEFKLNSLLRVRAAKKWDRQKHKLLSEKKNVELQSVKMKYSASRNDFGGSAGCLVVPPLEDGRATEQKITLLLWKREENSKPSTTTSSSLRFHRKRLGNHSEKWPRSMAGAASCSAPYCQSVQQQAKSDVSSTQPGISGVCPLTVLRVSF